MTPQQLVDKARNSNEFKYKYYGWSDSDIYNDIQTQYPDIEFPEFEEVIPESDSLMDADTSPGLFEWLGTASISTIGAEAGGVNEDFWKDSYNKSIAGLVYKSIHGEDRYKDVDYEADWLRQAGQFAVGLLSPIELAIFAASISACNPSIALDCLLCDPPTYLTTPSTIVIPNLFKNSA